MGNLYACVGCMRKSTPLLASLLDVQMRAVMRCCLNVQLECWRLARPQLALAAPQQLTAPLASCERLADCHLKTSHLLMLAMCICHHSVLGALSIICAASCMPAGLDHERWRRRQQAESCGHSSKQMMSVTLNADAVGQ